MQSGLTLLGFAAARLNPTYKSAGVVHPDMDLPVNDVSDISLLLSVQVASVQGMEGDSATVDHSDIRGLVTD
ncbi:MAG TPA: hypothetical protein VJ047_14285, partial [Pseudomonas sp.]|nr:hypothetical protein [Pseudomonas sp.]